MLTKQLDKQMRGDLTIFRGMTESFTCSNENTKVISLDDYDLKLFIYSSTDGVDTPVLEKTAVRITEFSGDFTISPEENMDDYKTLAESNYSYAIVRINKTNGAKILQQWGTLTIINIDG